MLRLRAIFACLALMLSALGTSLRADAPIYYSGGTAAINGYDPVSYFTDGEPVRGQAEIAVMWKGVIWYFASLAHRDAFEANPRAYAPQYGGYCAYAVSLGYRDATEPDAWVIVDSKLYLIRSPAVRTIWELDIVGNIGLADANWPSVLGE